MPMLSEEALQKLLCSFCKKYLSVFPIKVFPNRKVMCGRCEDKNDGTTSRLYELVARQLEFPCINRFEGCKEILPAHDVEKHETTCHSDEYTCPLCSDFNGSSYDLTHHMKINHKTAALENMVFLIEMDQGSKADMYFYCKNSIFIIVSYAYDASVQQLTLNLDIFGKQHRSQHNLMHQFLLYSIRNKLQYKTGNVIILEDGKGIMISLLKHEYPKNMIFYKFQVLDSSLILNNYRCNKEQVDVQCDLPQITNISTNEALLSFKFDNISKLDPHKHTHSSLSYFVGDILWSLLVIKTMEGETSFLSVYLGKDVKFQKLCKVEAKITLVSLRNQLSKSHNFVKNDFQGGLGYSTFINWNTLLNPNMYFVKEDSIEFQVLLKVLSSEEVKCQKTVRRVIQ